jgi:hypothetical protein
MRERPILFSAPMVRALLAGTKTQTRRVVQPQPPPEATSAGVISSMPPRDDDGEWTWLTGDPRDADSWETLDSFRCPYGWIGSRLWVREAWAARLDQDHMSAAELYAAGVRWAGYWADGPEKCCNTGCAGAAGRVRTGRFMPRWASRIMLEVVDVRVERLQEITEADARAEGVSGRDEFRALWDSINAKRGFGWDTNLWVFVVEFRRVGV